MPTINGRFYANPAYGRALERARLQDSEPQNPVGPPPARHRPHVQGHDAATNVDGVANQIYNETSGLRPSGLRSSGSDLDLQYARMYMGHVIRNRATGKVRGGLASSDLTPRARLATQSFLSKAYNAYGASHHAAKLSFRQADPTGGATNFYLDHGQTPPLWAQRKKLIATFGPFFNEAGGGDVPRAKEVKIRVYR
jgi:hypothetical protein